MMTNHTIPPVSSVLRSEIENKINFKTKPLGALGKLEKMALKISQIQHTLTPTIAAPHIVVYAADHGISSTGLVNAYPPEVTTQMVYNFVQGGAAINVFCRQYQIGLTVVDAGVNSDFEKELPIIHAKIGKGTKNYLTEPAMSQAECESAIEQGSSIVLGIHSKGCNCVGVGEMGIGNTSAAALIMSAILKIPIEKCVGNGTGVTPQQLDTKINTLRKVFELHQKKLALPLDILCCVGGFEIAMMVGSILQAAASKMIIVVDGFISTAAFLLAHAINKNVNDYAVFAHCSDEQGHRMMLNYLQADPLLALNMRLGEGTGAALAIPLLQSSVAFVNQMASFQAAGVSEKYD